MLNENIKEVINNEVLPSLHKVILMIKSEKSASNNSNVSKDFLSECHKLNNTIQQFIALQSKAYSRFNNYDDLFDDGVSTCLQRLAEIESSIGESIKQAGNNLIFSNLNSTIDTVTPEDK